MITLYQLRPDVPGSLGSGTVWSSPTSDKPHGPADVIHAQYVFDEWNGDCLICAHPVLAITEAAAAQLSHAGVTGLKTEPMKTSFSKLFPAKSRGTFPGFLRLIPTGAAQLEPRRPRVLTWTCEDVCDSNVGLIVTAKVLDVLRASGIPRCTVREVHFEPPP